MGSPPSAAHTPPWPRPRQSRGLWPEARWSEGAAPPSRPCRTGTAAPELTHSDDPPHAPWFASATHGPSVYPQPQPSGIPADPFSRSPYHSRAVLTDLDGGPWKTRIAEPPRRGVSRWHGDKDARRAVYNNRTRLRSEVGQQAMRNRAELVERSFAHILDRGGMRRTWLRGRENVHKRYLIHVAGHNLGLLMRLLIGAGTPKEAVAGGWCVLVLLPSVQGAATKALILVLVTNRAVPALIVLNMRLDRRPN